MSDKLNLIETIAREDKFSTFTRLMASSGTNGVFASGGDFTVFAPTNDAFAQVPERKLNELLQEPNQSTLKSLLSYHIVSGKVMAANLGSKPSRRAFNGDDLTFTDVGGLKVNGASVQARNMEAKNGVVHAVDTVLAPFSTSVTSRAMTAVAGKETASASDVSDTSPAAERPSFTGAPPTMQRLRTPVTAQATTKKTV